MKIVYLLEYPIDLPGGAQMSTESLCRGLLTKKGFTPIVVCPELLNKSKTDYPFEIITYPMGDKRIKNLLIRMKAFRKILRNLDADVIHIQMPESLITYGLAFPFAKKDRVIFTDRGMYFGYRKHSLMLMKWVLKSCEVMLTTTDLNRKLWLDNTKIRPIKKVANTIDEKFSKYDEDKKPHKGFVLGFAGRICEEKNWPLVNVICKSCKEAGIDIIADVVMSTYEAGDELVVKSVCDGLVNDLGSENVRTHFDFTQEEMSWYYYGVDVFVMTSRFESFGKAAVEAMSRKCAVVSTDVGGLSEVIGKDENLYTEDNIEKCVNRIKELYNDRELLISEQEYFYNRYRDNFSQDRCLKDHCDIYKGED